MQTDMKIGENELIDIIIKRANGLRERDFYLITETQCAIDRVQEALDKYKEMFEEHKKKHPKP